MRKIDFFYIFAEQNWKAMKKISSSPSVSSRQRRRMCVNENEREEGGEQLRNINDVSKKRRVINHAIATVWHDDHNKKSNFFDIFRV